ncbi:MAG: hypothetical protein AAGG72_04110 [Pseudomonadota bacterium]
MSKRREPPSNFETYVDRYESGEPIYVLAREAWASDKIMRRWLKEAGANMRGRSSNGLSDEQFVKNPQMSRAKRTARITFAAGLRKHNKTVDEIAALMNCSTATVREYLREARS